MPESLHTWERGKQVETTTRKNRAKLLRLPAIAADVSETSPGDEQVLVVQT